MGISEPNRAELSIQTDRRQVTLEDLREIGDNIKKPLPRPPRDEEWDRVAHNMFSVPMEIDPNVMAAYDDDVIHCKPI
jgi:hypothetical protein